MVNNGQCEAPRHDPPSRAGVVPRPRVAAPTIAIHGRALRYLRKQLGLTTREVALDAGVSDSYITKIERSGTPRRVNVTVFRGIRECLGLPVDEQGLLIAYTSDDEAAA